MHHASFSLYALQVKHYITFAIQHISSLLEKIVVFDRLVHIHYFPFVSVHMCAAQEKKTVKKAKAISSIFLV